MSKDSDEKKRELSAEDLEFLRDEGLELFSLFKSIRDVEKRDLVLELVKALAGTQQATDGSS